MPVVPVEATPEAGDEPSIFDKFDLRKKTIVISCMYQIIIVSIEEGAIWPILNFIINVNISI